MDDNFRFTTGRPETVADEIHFRFDHRNVVLRSPLQDKPSSQGSQIWNTRDIEEDVLWQHRSQSSQNLLSAPALPLKIDDV